MTISKGPLKTLYEYMGGVVAQKETTIAALFTLQEVCHCYWPGCKGESASYGTYTVTLTYEDDYGDFIIRKMEINNSKPTVSTNQCTFTVTHFQFVKWPENSVPQSTWEVLQVASLVQKVQISTGNKPIVVMCKYVALYVVLFIISLHIP